MQILFCDGFDVALDINCDIRELFVTNFYFGINVFIVIFMFFEYFLGLGPFLPDLTT